MKLVVNDSDIRLDKYLSLNTDFSRSLIEKMIASDNVLVNSEIKKASYKVCLDDVIEFDENFKEEVTFEKEKMDLNIVYEDDDLLVINKKSGLVVHPGSGNKTNTLVNGLMYYTDSLSDEGGLDRAGIVHRLDKDTSGLMLVAKTNKAHEILAEDFKNKNVKREYIALICGVFPSKNAKIDAPIGKSKKDFRLQEVTKTGKNAVTNLEVLKRYKNYTLVRLNLETGRTHQIRVHLNYIGYPVYNDPAYGVSKTVTSFGQFLHSEKITFTHPITKKELSFTSKLPKVFDEFIKELEVSPK